VLKFKSNVRVAFDAVIVCAGVSKTRYKSSVYPPTVYENIPEATATGWIASSFDLSAYIGDTVQIRFAFASDGATSTGNDANWIGMLVDNIAFGGFTNNGSEDGQMTYSSLVVMGTDLWHIGIPGDAPSPVNALICQNATGSYDTGMDNYIESPSILLPSAGEIRCDFMIKGDFDDNDIFPNVDSFGWEISVDGGLSWMYMSNPYGIQGGNNYIYTDAPNLWSSMVESYSLDGVIDNYAGMNAKFRIYFHSDDDTPIGTGIMLDDFTIYHNQNLPSPLNLIVNTNLMGEPTLNWNSPMGGGAEGWLFYGDLVQNDIISLTSPGNWDVALKVNPIDLAPYIGYNITEIKLWTSASSATYTASIWSGTTGGVTEISEAVGTHNLDDWTTTALSTPVNISSGETYWIGASINQSVGSEGGLGTDSGPSVNGLWYRNGGTFSDLSSQFNYNWLIQAYLDDPVTGRSLVWNNWGNELTERTTLEGYKIYRTTDTNIEPTLIDSIVNEDITSWTDSNAVGDMINYYAVSAVYDVGESDYTDLEGVFVASNTMIEYSNDDGHVDASYTVPTGEHIAVKFTPSIDPGTGHADLEHVNFWLETLGSQSVVLKIWDDSGPNETPGSNHLAFQIIPNSNLVAGWNYLTLNNPISITSGSFYVGFMGTPSPSGLGVDVDNSGASFIASPTWSNYNAGNFMIRAIVDVFVITPLANVSGHIEDENGVPISGANIQLTGSSSYGGVTNVSGDFSINDVDANISYLLTASYTDFETHTQTILVDSLNYDVGTIVLAQKAYSQIKLYLEGAYDIGTSSLHNTINAIIPLTSPYSDGLVVNSMPADVVDWVLIELRSSATGMAVALESMLLLTTGYVQDVNGSTPRFSVTPGDYYAIIMHRNHIATMSATAATFEGNPTTTNLIDFTVTNSTYSCTTANAGVLEIETGVFALIGGETTDEASTIGTITDQDKSEINSISGFVGYLAADTNLSTTVTDADKASINLNLNRYCHVPMSSTVLTNGIYVNQHTQPMVIRPTASLPITRSIDQSSLKKKAKQSGGVSKARQ